jgi:Ca2+-binding RTX toxin-like protein
MFLAMLAVTLPTTAQAQAQTQQAAPANVIRVTVENVTTNQPLTPPVVALHDADTIRLYEAGQAASEGIEAIAENGMNAPLLDALGAAAADVVSAFGEAGPTAGTPVIFPGGTGSVDLVVTDPTHSLSLASMVICTNDGFTGLNSVAVPPAGESVTLDAIVYDAGTETNIEDGDYWVPPCTGGSNQTDDEGGVIAAHPGQTGGVIIDDFAGAGLIANTSADFAAGATVAQVTIENLGGPDVVAYQVDFTNVSPNQPMTPPVVAIHDAAAQIFVEGEAASAEVIAIAENGMNQPLVDFLAGAGIEHGVALPADGPRPLFPSADVNTASVTIPGEPGDVLSYVSMIICTNDGFTGINSLPLGDTVQTVTGVSYDAGSETNVLDQDYWVPPCSNGVATDNLTNDGEGLIAVHPGQSGGPDIEFPGRPVYNSDVGAAALMEVTITPVFGDFMVAEPEVVGPVAICHGLEVTINLNTNGGVGTGTAGDDVIMGTAGDDMIEGLAGNDTICGRDGNDVARGDDGDDTIFGGAGADVLRGNAGVDYVDGGVGFDRVLGGIDGDTLIGGTGNDFLGGFGGADMIDGGDGDDTIFGGFGADVINGGAGNDVISGLVGDDTINGGDGDDELNGDRGNDTINGDAGNDVIKGGNANDILDGGDGDDSVNGGKADDQLSGGEGTDDCAGNLQINGDTADATCENMFGIP